MNKFVKSATLTGALLLGVTVAGTADTTPAQAATVKAEKHVRAKLIGWADMNSFEVKTDSGKYYVMRTDNRWYYNNLKEGQYYTFYYTTNKYGQNIITKINK
ncbi:lysis protein [Bacillus phage 015DV002]|nr:lysis protein [Bacillus phage 015DV002]QQO41232.1 lysis protein [Bacillus phage 015DV004]